MKLRIGNKKKERIYYFRRVWIWVHWLNEWISCHWECECVLLADTISRWYLHKCHLPRRILSSVYVNGSVACFVQGSWGFLSAFALIFPINSDGIPSAVFCMRWRVSCREYWPRVKRKVLSTWSHDLWAQFSIFPHPRSNIHCCECIAESTRATALCSGPLYSYCTTVSFVTIL